MSQVSIRRIDVHEVRHLRDIHIDVPGPDEAMPRVKTIANDTHMGEVRSACFSPDGNRLAFGADDGSLHLVDAHTLERVAIIRGFGGRIHSICFSPNGNLLASGADDGFVCLWNAHTHKLVSKLSGHRHAVNSVCISPDGSMLASGSDDGTVRLWDIRTRKQLSELPGNWSWVHSVCFSPDSQQLVACTSDSIKVWDVHTETEVNSLNFTSENGRWMRSCCLSPNGDLLALGGDNGLVCLWSIKSGDFDNLSPLNGHGGSIHTVAFSPDGNLLASGSDDGTVVLCDTRTLDIVARLDAHEGPVHSVSFSPDGSLLASSSADGTVRLWDIWSEYSTQAPRSHSTIEVVPNEPAAESCDSIKHLIFTGKNGSGKTSLLDAIAECIDSICSGDYFVQADNAKPAVDLTFSLSETIINQLYQHGDCVFAYFGAQRKFNAIVPQYIEKVTFADHYALHESPRDVFVKYLLDLKMTQALALSNGRRERADEIARWFDGIRDVLRKIYEDPTLTIEFNEDTYEFTICQEGRVPFDINHASDGFSAILDIVVGLMLRMVRKNSRSFRFDLPGIALIDEIENHLHLSLQKQIIPYLTELFPNIQFVVTTHSPFVLSSVSNAVIYDLESHTLVTDGLAGNTYESIVEGYFNVDLLSDELRRKFDRYQELTALDKLGDGELDEVEDLELYLDEIPDYLALGITTEYQKLKLLLHAKVAGR